MGKLCACTEKVADQHDEQARALFAFANGLTEIGNAEDKTCDVRGPFHTLQLTTEAAFSDVLDVDRTE
jgi:hypothetical protein